MFWLDFIVVLFVFKYHFICPASKAYQSRRLNDIFVGYIQVGVRIFVDESYCYLQQNCCFLSQ